MNELRMDRELVDEMVAHCLEQRPNEACGILASAGGEIVRVIPMLNVKASPVLYAFDSDEYFKNLYRVMPREGWDLGGVYHSHTRTEPIPSPTDIKEASEAVPYLIVSLADEPPNIRTWLIEKEDWEDKNPNVSEIPFIVTG